MKYGIFFININNLTVFGSDKIQSAKSVVYFGIPPLMPALTLFKTEKHQSRAGHLSASTNRLGIFQIVFS